MNPTSSSGLSGAWLIFLFIAPFLGVGIVLAILWPTGEPELRYITGCEGSKLVAPVVNLFAEPSTPPVVAQLAGSGGIRCRGSVVIVQERRWRDRRLFARVVNVAGGETGWVLDRFIGPDFDTARCLGVFGTTSTDAVRRCEGR